MIVFVILSASGGSVYACVRARWLKIKTTCARLDFDVGVSKEKESAVRFVTLWDEQIRRTRGVRVFGTRALWNRPAFPNR